MADSTEILFLYILTLQRFVDFSLIVTECSILFYFSDDLLTLLSPEYPNLISSELVVEGEQCYSHGWIKRKQDTCPSEPDDRQVICQFGRQFCLKSSLKVTDYNMFYIGQEGATLRNFMMTWNRCSFRSFDPMTMIGRAESVSINRALMKRYYAIERARDANVVGILVGTLGVADYLTIIQQLKETIHRAGKKSYMFAMGKLNVPKLANFLEIDIFVLIACPENSLLDSSEFYKPVVTPFEMEVACNKKREWSEEYVTDFRHLLPGWTWIYTHHKFLNQLFSTVLYIKGI